jgi:6-phosphogluconolactonase
MDEQPPEEAVTTEEQPTPEAIPPELPPRTPQIHRYANPDGVAKAAAKRFLDTAKRAVDKYDRFIVVLAGGSTPKLLYSLLTASPYREKVPWKKTFFVFGDERCVPPDDEASNYRMAQETLFAPLETPEHRVLRMKGERQPERAAQLYEVRLGDLFLGRSKRYFDLVLLGIGADGHTASLFPGTTALEEQERWVVANHVPQIDAWRLTLTLKALNSTRRVMFLATGEEKAQVIAEAFGGVEHETRHPCELVAPYYARKEVLIDREAASKMPQEVD